MRTGEKEQIWGRQAIWGHGWCGRSDRLLEEPVQEAAGTPGLGLGREVSDGQAIHTTVSGTDTSINKLHCIAAIKENVMR